MKKGKRIKRIGLFLIAFGLLFAYIGTYHIAPYAIIARHELTKEVDWNSFQFNAVKANVVVSDSLKLDSYLITPKTDSLKGILIMVHGIGSCKEQFISLSQKLAQQQIGTFLFDLRAHGKSEGEFVTYGYYEKHDIKEIVSFLKLKHPEIPIGIWGSSLGGAVAIQALEIEKKIDFGIIECAFTRLEQIVFDYQKRFLFGIGIKPITDRALNRAGEIANFNPDEVQPIKSVRKITQPMLIAHGDMDIHILPKYGKELFDSLASKEKEFILVEGADHNYIHAIGGIEYENKVMDFIKRQLK